MLTYCWHKRNYVASRVFWLNDAELGYNQRDSCILWFWSVQLNGVEVEFQPRTMTMSSLKLQCQCAFWNFFCFHNDLLWIAFNVLFPFLSISFSACLHYFCDFDIYLVLIVMKHYYESLEEERTMFIFFYILASTFGRNSSSVVTYFCKFICPIFVLNIFHYANLTS